MSNYTETYYQSILAQASYGIFPQFVGGMSDEAAKVFLSDKDLPSDAHIPPVLIDDLLSRFDVEEHYPDDATGFSATVFKDSDGRYVMSIRGTDVVNDPWSDLVIADIAGVV